MSRSGVSCRGVHEGSEAPSAKRRVDKCPLATPAEAALIMSVDQSLIEGFSLYYIIIDILYSILCCKQVRLMSGTHDTSLLDQEGRGTAEYPYPRGNGHEWQGPV
jgi:hypothetical protein